MEEENEIPEHKVVDSDLLNRGEFIAFLTEVIETKLTAKEQYSFAIDGLWGAGKSFVLDCLEGRLKSKYLVIRYNCWKHDYYEEPLIGLLSEFAKALNTEQTFDYEEHEKKFKILLGKGINAIIKPMIEAKTGLNVDQIVGEFNNIRDVLSLQHVDASKVNANLPVDALIEQIQDCLAQLFLDSRGIVLLVDELDRCLPDYAIKVLERLHHLCEGSRIVQVLAVDSSKLDGSIRKAFGKMPKDAKIKLSSEKKNNEFDDFFSEEYLQKFIHNTFKMGTGSINGHEMELFNGFEKLFDLSNDVNDVKNFSEVIFKDIPIRVVKQVCDVAKTTHQMTLKALGIEQSTKYDACHMMVEMLWSVCCLHYHEQIENIICYADSSKIGNGHSISIKIDNPKTHDEKLCERLKIFFEDHSNHVIDNQTKELILNAQTLRNKVAAFCCNGHAKGIKLSPATSLLIQNNVFLRKFGNILQRSSTMFS